MQLFGRTFMASQQAEDPMLKITGLQKNGYYVEIKGERYRQMYSKVELRRHGY